MHVQISLQTNTFIDENIEISLRSLSVTVSIANAIRRVEVKLLNFKRY